MPSTPYIVSGVVKDTDSNNVANVNVVAHNTTQDSEEFLFHDVSFT